LNGGQTAQHFDTEPSNSPLRNRSKAVEISDVIHGVTQRSVVF